jgi:hypothetical protein
MRSLGSAEEQPTPEQVQQWQRRMPPPENEFPAGVGMTVLLGRASHVHLGIETLEDRLLLGVE